MSATTLYWHDYETWGTNPGADKPSQFAGIRTDEDLNIVGEPLMLYCRPADDCLPQPMASLVTGISPQRALEEGVPELQFIQRILEELGAPGTCGVGYNSLRFDDEVTRHTLYRNLLDPYEREWRSGNSRWDIIDMVRLTYALRPEGIEWPQREGANGEKVPSFRLEELTAANGIAHEGAHDALSDVRATIDMARLIRQRQPRLYDYVFRLRNKREAAAMIDLQARKPLLHVSGKVPASQGHLTYILPLAAHPVNRNAIIAANLAMDPEPILNLDADALRERLYTGRDKLAEGELPAGLKLIHLNRCPVLAPPNMLDDKRAVELGIDKEACERHWQALKSKDLREKLQQVFADGDFPERDVEASLYSGFLADADRDLCRQLHRELQTRGPEALAAPIPFTDTRLPELLFRLRARNFPDTLSAEEQQRWQEWRYRRLTDPAAGASITLEPYFEQIAELREQYPERAGLLDQLEAWGDGLLV
ncbi:exodeoxyribonuclease I [Microbulbifer flavimaris]|uniref:Exodeoxyribonuclease I n=1 Tax=Microbulbifer flavimaris TaxID=1781068 RepID=A0ABX4HW97_9GAMM|nr:MULTISPECIES: exodeoxyribonuclease I [Microbulbifer]KUJ81469.1 exodeoxyribonuclease I [Microbulbifer sp. ZGT114]PCO04379.1 exodeoxyribonuclease I [Microbulbifer flavimaris]